MSHYTKVATKITRKSALITALKAMGFSENAIESFDSAQQMKGYQGDGRAQKAHIRIKGSGWGHGQNYVGGASNDLGWEQQADGSFAFHVSNYDKGKYNQQWQGKLADEYSRAVVHEVCEEQNFFIESETEAQGEIFIKISSTF